MRWLYISFLFILRDMTQQRAKKSTPQAAHEKKIKTWVILNISLSIISLLLLLQLFDIPTTIAGKAYQTLTPGTPLCAVQWENDKTLLPNLDQCCYYARTQTRCEQKPATLGKEQLQWDCYTGSPQPNTIHYLLNQKAYRYCQQIPLGVN